MVDFAGESLLVAGADASGRTTALVARAGHLAATRPLQRTVVVCRNRGAAQRFDLALTASGDAPLANGTFGGRSTGPAAPVSELATGTSPVGIPAVTTVHGLAFDVATRAGLELRLLTTGEQRQMVKRLLDHEDPSAWPTLGHLLKRAAMVDEVCRGLNHLPSALGSESSGAEQDPMTVTGAGPAWSELAAFARHYHAALAEAGALDSVSLLATARELLDQGRVDPPVDHLLVDHVDLSVPGVVELLSAVARRATTVIVAADAIDHGTENGATKANRAAAVQKRGGPTNQGGATGDRGLDRAAVITGPEATTVTITDAPHQARPSTELVIGRHPSMEPEMVAAEVLAAHDGGLAWSDMAVLVRRPYIRIGPIAAALRRHGVPVVASHDPDLVEHPMARALVSILKWIETGDDSHLDPTLGHDTPERLAGPFLTAAWRDSLRGRYLDHAPDPAGLAFDVARRLVAGAVEVPGAPTGAHRAFDRGLDAVVALLDALSRYVDRHRGAGLAEVLAAIQTDEIEPDPWRVEASIDPLADAVTVTSIEASAGGHWHTVVLTGCVEGQFPALSDRIPLFDPFRLAGAVPTDHVPSAGDRRWLGLVDERRLFARAVARATHRVVGAAAPAPGVLTSRFVEGWPGRSAQLATPPSVSHPRPPPSPGLVPVVDMEAGLSLSATRLDTYEDCPRRYLFEYVMRAREEAGISAELGSRVHRVLADFLAPEVGVSEPPARSRERLFELAEQHWDDNIAPYRPQVEKARSLYVEMLDNWWATEGSSPDGPRVLGVEVGFGFDLAQHRVTGAIDRLDRADQGTGVRVVDYKTGSIEPRAADVADNVQLAVYHLAVTHDPALAAMGSATELRLLYLRSMNVHEQPVTESHARATEERILATAEAIGREEFEPAFDANCRYCSFARLCPIQPQGREVGCR